MAWYHALNCFVSGCRLWECEYARVYVSTLYRKFNDQALRYANDLYCCTLVSCSNEDLFLIFHAREQHALELSSFFY